MKQKMKKFLCMLLLIVMCFNIPLIGASAAGPEDKGNLLEDVANDANEMMKNQANQLKGISEGVERLVNDMDTKKLIADQMSVYNDLMGGIRTISLGLGLINGTVSMLKLIGVIQDPVSQKLDSIYDCLLDVQETVHTIDKRTEDIQKSLIAEASTSQYNFRLERYDEYRQAWDTFFTSGGSYDELNRLMKAYQSELNSRMIKYTESWQDGKGSPVRVLYNEEGTLILSGKNMDGGKTDLPKEPSYSDDGLSVSKSITIPAEYIVPADKFVDAESYLKLLETAIKAGTQKALEEKKITFSDENFYQNYEGLEASEKAEVAETLSKDFLDTVMYDAAYETANMTYGVGTFANAVNSAFATFSSTMLGANGVTSPLEAGLSKLYLTHGFEGEVKEDAASICAYLAEAGVLYGEFTSLLVSMDKGFSTKAREEVIKSAINTAYYPICYHDSFITGYDDYCYPLNAVLGYNEISYKARYYYADGKPYEPKEDSWKMVNENPQGTLEEAQKVLDENRMLSKEDMALLYLYYDAAASKDSSITDFNSYLDSIGLLPPKTYEETTTNLFGRKETKTRTFKASSYYLTSKPERYNLMDRKVAEYRTKDKTWGPTLMLYNDIVRMEPGSIDYSKEGESTVFYHDRMRADVFDTKATSVSLDNRINNQFALAERAYTYYVLKKNYGGVGEYVYVVFADPHSNFGYAFNPKGDCSFTVHSQDYSMLSYVNTDVRGNNTASIFTKNNIFIICGCVAILAGGIAIAASKKKKKDEAGEEAA